jgi:protein TonB
MSTPNIAISSLLPWDPLPGESKRLRTLVGIMLALAFLIWLIVPYVPKPPVDKAKEQAVAEHLNKAFVRLQQEVKEKPKPVPKVETKTDEKKDKPTEAEKPKEAAKPESTPEPVASKPVANAKIEAAREKARQAIQDQGFGDLDDMKNAFNAPSGAGLGNVGAGAGSGGLIKGTQAAGTSRNMITSAAGQGSGVGAYTGAVSSGFGGGKAGGQGSAGVLGAGGGGAGGKLQTVQSGIGAAVAANARPVGKDGKARRTQEEIRKVFDQYGAKLNNAYQKALRDDPSMQGTVAFKLTIAPDGSVASCDITSSDLNNPELENKLKIIVKGFNFGADNVDAWTGPYRLNFAPGG